MLNAGVTPVRYIEEHYSVSSLEDFFLSKNWGCNDISTKKWLLFDCKYWQYTTSNELCSCNTSIHFVTDGHCFIDFIQEYLAIWNLCRVKTAHVTHKLHVAFKFSLRLPIHIFVQINCLRPPTCTRISLYMTAFVCLFLLQVSEHAKSMLLRNITAWEKCDGFSICSLTITLKWIIVIC